MKLSATTIIGLFVFTFALLSISEANMFPNRNSFYTYKGLVESLNSYPAFANEGGSNVEKMEMAALLAHVDHDTNGLKIVRESNKDNYNLYCDPAGSCGSKQYYGRGPLQLSWNYNYADAGKALKYDLLNNPDLVATDAKISWSTALWFWMASGDKPCHKSIVIGSFSGTIRTISGGIECDGRNSEEMHMRINSYKKFCGIVGVNPGNDLSC
ncbi:secreted chitinase [Cavenderia fasciculata]|uniref:Secreted chitinase n=1 Tax=Cavenderia fasciculata TaxID=261658 RepID=F4PK75_CACFS|nr:secreted chitinase [Cavenderia fasciculata]EGG23999.1 secreted chitinase [Cavenderia fasciculata]|eukprot:XP_004361850.1 secreted chitinase [Cavenderia fasciculata]